MFGIDRVVGIDIVDSSRTRDQFQVLCRRGDEDPSKLMLVLHSKEKSVSWSEILEKQCRVYGFASFRLVPSAPPSHYEVPAG